VLKKAGIVVATAAAGLLAVSPLAFAGDKDDHDHDRDRHGNKVKVDDVNRVDDSNEADGRELIFIADNNVAVNNCTNTRSDDDALNLINDVTGALTLLSLVQTDESSVQVCDQDAEVDDSIEQDIDD
jgi:hypothetical protein